MHKDSDSLASSQFSVWCWRLVPFFSVLAIFTAWSAWRDSYEDETVLRAAIQSSALDWNYVQGITGKKMLNR
jgi:hypothetical protein